MTLVPCSNTYSPKRANKCKKMVKNDKKCQKITNNWKISEITKYGNTKIYKNVKQCKKMPKMPKMGLKRPKNGQISEFFCYRFSGSKLYLKKWY